MAECEAGASRTGAPKTQNAKFKQQLQNQYLRQYFMTGGIFKSVVSEGGFLPTPCRWPAPLPPEGHKNHGNWDGSRIRVEGCRNSVIA